MTVIPEQLRSIDPYSAYRYSSVINRLTRVITGGNDIVLNPDVSFPITRTGNSTIEVGPGLCIKDDVLIHVTEENYEIDLDNQYFYVDDISGNAMDQAGYYYLVLQYSYARTLPSPKAAYKIIKNTSVLYTPYSEKYIFLGTVKVEYSSGLSRYIVSSENDAIRYFDPDDSTVTRPTQMPTEFEIDCGELS